MRGSLEAGATFSSLSDCAHFHADDDYNNGDAHDYNGDANDYNDDADYYNDDADDYNDDANVQNYAQDHHSSLFYFLSL